MDPKQKLLIRNILAGTVLLILIVLVLAWLGVFEGEQSDEAQVRALIERSREETNDHDWDDLFDLTDMSEEDKQAWIKSVPQQANFVVLDSITPDGFIGVPEGATSYEQDVTVVAHLEVPIAGNIQADSVKGTLYFVKKKDRWFIDWNKSAPTFPYIPSPKR